MAGALCGGCDERPCPCPCPLLPLLRVHWRAVVMLLMVWLGSSTPRVRSSERAPRACMKVRSTATNLGHKAASNSWQHAVRFLLCRFI